VLYESASGYALFEGLDMDEIGQTQEAVQETITYVAGPARYSDHTRDAPVAAAPHATLVTGSTLSNSSKGDAIKAKIHRGKT
jgi:hypothetical protein